jgi:hypothetical protein
MARIIKGYLDKITKIQKKVDNETDDLLQFINLDSLLANPQGYMSELNKQFFENLQDEMLEAVEAGEEKANRILKKIES